MVKYRIPRAGFGPNPPLQRMINDFLHPIEAFNRLRSQWKIDYIIDFSNTLAPFRSAQGSSFIPTPTHIAAKKCVVNVKNCNDELYFLYSILAHIHRVKLKQNQSRVWHHRPHRSELDTTGLTFPLPVKDVAKFERLNEDITVNVMTFDENTSSTCCCWRMTKEIYITTSASATFRVLFEVELNTVGRRSSVSIVCTVLHVNIH